METPANNLLAENQIINKWIVNFFGGFGKTKTHANDVVRQAKVILDTMPESDLLISALLKASLSTNFQKVKSHIKWKVIHLPPQLSEEDNLDVPPEVITNFDSLDISHIREDLHWGLRQGVIKRFKERSVQNPDLDMVINFYATASFFKGAMIDFNIGHSYSFDHFYMNDVKKIKDPYYKARCLFHIYSLYEYNNSINAEDLEFLFKTIRQIKNPHRQVRIWELCMSLIESHYFQTILEEIKKQIGRINDIENRSRAYGRMALLLPASVSREWFKEAIETAGNIQDANRKSQTLQEIYRVLPRLEELLQSFEEIVNNINDSWLRAKAYDRLTDELANNPPAEIYDLIQSDKELWAPILLGGTISTAIKQFYHEEDIEEVWKQYADNHDEALFNKLFKAGQESNRLTLTYNAARAIESLMDGYAPRENFKEHLYKLFPLLSNATLQTANIIAKWQDNLDLFIKGHAYLLNIENGKKITEEDIPALISLLDTDNDLSRLRAYLAIGSNIWNVEKERFIKVSTLGANVIEKIAEELYNVRPHEHFKRLGLRVFFGNIIQDDSATLTKWATNDHPIHHIIIKEIEAIGGDDTLATYLKLMNSNISDEMKESFFISSCKLAALNNTFVQDFTSFVSWGDEFKFKNYYYENLYYNILTSLKEISIIDNLNEKEKVKLISTKISNASISIQDILKGKTSFASVGNTFYRKLDGIDQDSIGAAQYLVNNSKDSKEIDKTIRLLYCWLYEELNSENSNLEPSNYLIRLLAEISKLMPNAFIVLNEETPIIDDLIARFNDYSSVWTRRGCIVLIGCLRKINRGILDLYLDQSKEDRDIWRSTIDSINKITYFDVETLNDLLDHLFKELNHQSSIRAYFASRILVSLGKNNHTNTIQKRNILKKLTQASQDVLANRNVYIFRGTGKNKDDVISIHNLITLEKAYNQAIVEIIGIS